MEVTVLGCIKGTALSFKTLMNTVGYTSVVQRDVLVFFVTYNFEMEILVHMCCTLVLLFWDHLESPGHRCARVRFDKRVPPLWP